VTDTRAGPAWLGLALALATAACTASGPIRHGPGEGPLDTVGDPWSMGLDATAADTWTLGLLVCSPDAGRTPVLDAITPRERVGDVAILGTGARVFRPDEQLPIMSLPGWPPDPPTPLRPIEGFAVYQGCSRDDLEQQTTELLVGLGERGHVGGGWLGQDVAYHVGDQRYVLELDYDFLVCGSATPADRC
jgi:hypothetical protein